MTFEQATKDFVIYSVYKQVRDKDGTIYLERVYDYKNIDKEAPGKIMADENGLGTPLLSFVLDGVEEE